MLRLDKALGQMTLRIDGCLPCVWVPHGSQGISRGLLRRLADCYGRGDDFSGQSTTGCGNQRYLPEIRNTGLDALQQEVEFRELLLLLFLPLVRDRSCPHRMEYSS